MIDQIINAKMQELIEKGEVDKIVEEHLKKAIASIIDSSLRSYSDVGKALEKKLNESMLSGMDKIDFTVYRDVVIGIIQKELNGTVAEYAAKPVQESIAKFMDVIEKKEWNLSEIIERFLEDIVEDKDMHEDGNISFVMKQSSHGTFWIGFDENPGKTEDYNCKYRIAINEKDGKLWYFTIDDRPVDPSKTSSIYGFDEFLFKLYANKVKVNIDSVNTSWSTYE